MHDRIAAMWARLALIGAGGLVAGALLSVALARWVGRPLRAVDAAALRLGEGTLDVRAAGGRGPREVRRLASTFNTMAARMEALIHGHRAVVADVSHQLRTPLTALRLRLDLLVGGRRRGHRGGARRRAGGDRPAVPAGGRAAGGGPRGERGAQAGAGAGGRGGGRPGGRLGAGGAGAAGVAQRGAAAPG